MLTASGHFGSRQHRYEHHGDNYHPLRYRSGLLNDMIDDPTFQYKALLNNPSLYLVGRCDRYSSFPSGFTSWI